MIAPKGAFEDLARLLPEPELITAVEVAPPVEEYQKEVLIDRMKEFDEIYTSLKTAIGRSGLESAARK